MIELTPQYLAGFFDADGSVGIYNIKTKGNNSYQVNITIANSGWHGRVICNLLRDKFGGSIIETTAKKSTHRNAFWYKINGFQKVKEFLLYIKDHLIIKKDQAILCLEFIDKVHSKYRQHRTEEEIKEYEQYELKCKEMKRKC